MFELSTWILSNCRFAAPVYEQNWDTIKHELKTLYKKPQELKEHYEDSKGKKELLTRVEGEGKLRYYHASPNKNIPIGTILESGSKSGFKGLDIDTELSDKINSNDYVYMSNSPVPHFTVSSPAYFNNWTVYEVVPVNKNQKIFKGPFSDLKTSAMKVVRKVGDGRGIVNNYWKRLRKEDVPVENQGSFLSPKREVPNLKKDPDSIGVNLNWLESKLISFKTRIDAGEKIVGHEHSEYIKYCQLYKSLTGKDICKSV